MRLFDPIAMATCSVCGAGLNRYTLNTLKSLIRIRGATFTHKCGHCKTTYSPSIRILLLLIVGLNFVELPTLEFNDGSEVLLTLSAIATAIILLIAYALPISPFTKLKKWSGNEG